MIMPSGKPAARLREVAELARVSVSTASRALNGDTRISPPTRRRVEKAAARLAYRVNPVARSLSMRRSFTVGLIVGDLANPFFTTLARGVDSVLSEADYMCLLADMDGLASRQGTIAERLVDRRVDGLIVTVPHDPAVLELAEVPVVAVDRCEPPVPYVATDNVLGGRLVAEHLIEEGYERIGILYADPSLPPIADRYLGFREGLTAAGRALPVEHARLCPTLKYEDAYTGAQALLDAGADAVFAVDDVMAAAVLDVAIDRGLAVPGQVGIVGYDDTTIASWRSLTSAAQATYELGRLAARRILDLIEKPEEEVASAILPPRLVVRQSSSRRESLAGLTGPSRASWGGRALD